MRLIGVGTEERGDCNGFNRVAKAAP